MVVRFCCVAIDFEKVRLPQCLEPKVLVTGVTAIIYGRVDALKKTRHKNIWKTTEKNEIFSIKLVLFYFKLHPCWL
jgi:hypothetical protein